MLDNFTVGIDKLNQSIIYSNDAKKREASKKLNDEVEKWLASGGVINGSNTEKVKVGFNNSLKDAKSRLNAEYYEASRQRKGVQVPIIQDYSSWGGDKKWSKLSKAVGGKVSAGTLSNINNNKTTIADIEVWREVVKAIEILKGSV